MRPDRLLSTADVATHLGVSVRWIRYLTKHGRIAAPRYRFSGRRAYDVGQLPALRAQFAKLPRRGAVGRERPRKEKHAT